LIFIMNRIVTYSIKKIHMKPTKLYIILFLIGIMTHSCYHYENISYYDEDRKQERVEIEKQKRLITNEFIQEYADVYISVNTIERPFRYDVFVKVFGDYSAENVIIKNFFLRDKMGDKIAFNSTTAVLNQFCHLGFELISENRHCDSRNRRYTFKRKSLINQKNIKLNTIS